jgi:RNA polymerase sigma factor (sigma-70 family)
MGEGHPLFGTRNGGRRSTQLPTVNEIMAKREKPPDAAQPGRVAEFEQVYRAHIREVTAYFARRTSDPQTVADLTADTFVRAITSFATFDPARGSPRGWLFTIARRVFANHCERTNRGLDAVVRLAGRRTLEVDEVAELIVRIDAERAVRTLLDDDSDLSRTDRDVIELVDLSGLTVTEAAQTIGISQGALRIRLFRARARLRKIAGEHHG